MVVELLSLGTEKEDLGQTDRAEGQPLTKWDVYEQILRVPYYVVFDRYTDQLRAFVLQAGHYQEQALEEPKIWIAGLHIGLGLWQGEYQGSDRRWLRWYDREGAWIPTDTEMAEFAQQQAERAQRRAEAERQRAEQAEAKLEALRQKLREAGIDPDT